jgi:CRISPR-associated endonuclease Csy4
MNYSIDIKVLPDAEFSPSLLMNALFVKLHRALAGAGNGEVGVSFPDAQKTLGDSIRVHGSQVALQRLMSISWLKGLTDYTCVASICAIPDNCQYRVVKRVQAKSSIERMYRRSVKKGWLTTEEAGARMSAGKEQHLKLPFVQLKSQTTGQSFRLFIQQGKLSNKPVEGKFTAYGLSEVATIPWF